MVRICVYCGKEIEPGQSWTEDPVASGNYWHAECHAKAVSEWTEIYRKSGEPWEKYIESIKKKRKISSETEGKDPVPAVELMTIGFKAEIPDPLKFEIIRKTREKISPKTDFIVFRPEEGKDHYEDEGRTYVYYMPELPKKVYAKLDDFGSPEILSEQLGSKVDTQYVITYMLAEEY